MKVCQIIVFDVQPAGLQDQLIKKAKLHEEMTEEVGDAVFAAAVPKLHFQGADYDREGFAWLDGVVAPPHGGTYRVRVCEVEPERLANLFATIAELQGDIIAAKEEVARYAAALGREI